MRRPQAVMFVIAVLGVLAGWAPRAATAQELTLAERRPRFLYAPSAGATPVEIEADRYAVFRRVIRLQVERPTIGRLLTAIEQQTGLTFAYDDNFPTDRPLELRADAIPVAVALSGILLDTGVDVVLSPRGRVALVRVPARAGAGAAGIITGRVTDAKSGEGLSGADVFVDGTRWRANTGPDGRYRIAAVEAGSYTLAVRRIGYRRESRAVRVVDGEEVTVDVALEPQPTQLNEIVTTVTGDQRRVELGHVVGRINADSLVKEAPVSNLSELLTGRVPGLQVFQSQGTVGGEVKLQVRGANSLLLNTEPIVIVDGVRYSNAATQRPLEFGPARVEPTSPLNDLNPDDIETIEVVKGPSAATLYGTDAANGVLVITTKRGRAGPARWSAYARGTTSEIPRQHYPDRYWGWGTVFGVPDNTSISCSLALLADGWCTQQDSVTVLPNPLNDPALTILGTKPRWEYGVNVAGGRQDLRYYFSGDYEDATGPVQMPVALAEQLKAQRGLSELPDEWRNPNALTRLNLRANVTALLGETAELRVNTGYLHSATRSLAAGGGSPYSQGAFRGGPASPYTSDGGADPASAFVQTSTERTDRMFGSAGGQWRPLPWLTTRATVGLDFTSRNRYSLARRGEAPNDSESRDGVVQDDRVRQVTTTAELGATATVRRGRLSARTAVGAQYVRNLNDALGSLGINLPPGGSSVGEAATVFSQQGYAETVTLGSYLEETLGWNERLFLTGALRVDGASAFGQDYDATVYPKVSASWLLSEEPFLPHVPGLDELRLRYAFGASGQQPRPAMARPGFTADRTVENGAAVPVIRLDELGNPAIQPERVREHEFGFDATGLASRLRLGLTWYERRTVDQIIAVQLPRGLGATFTNLGLTTQHGFEAELTARVLETRSLSWDITVQHALHRTRLVDLGGAGAQPSPEGGWVEGYPLGGRFQRPLLGYADANGDAIIAGSEVQLGDTAVYVGESTPPKSQTLTTIVGLFERRLRLSALLERRTGFTQINALQRTQCVHGVCQAQVDPSTPLAEQAQAQHALMVGGVPEPGDFTRLREVTAALDLPLGLVRAFRVRSATLALSVRNLALWTDFSGPDPESAAVGQLLPVRGGVAEGLPQGRSWTVRLDLGL